MSSLPGFSKVNTISHVEIDQPFEKSMQQLNENQKYYVFPEDANIINKNGQILEWKKSSDVYLFPINATTFQDKDGLQYYMKDDILHVQDEINVMADWDYTTKFINASTGEIYNQIICSGAIINISDSGDTIKIPSIFHIGGGGFQIKLLNCILDITHFQEYQEIFAFDTSLSNTGKIIMTSVQKDYFIERQRVIEENNVLWFVDHVTTQKVVQVEVQS